ncbi:MAG TPA: phage tail protein [Terricaulis sp.]|nr:phage tail protein [Terricaulis sp.]
MPPVIAAIGAAWMAIGAAVAYVGLTAAAWAALGKALAYLIISSIISRALAPKPSSDAGGALDQGRQLALKFDPEFPREIVVGRAAVGGSTVYATVTGPDNKYLWRVIAVSDCEVHGCVEVWGNGEKLTFDGDVNTGWRTCSSHFGAKLSLIFYKGTDDQTADAALVAAAPSGEWTENCRGRGIAYAIVRMEFEPNAFPNGEPSLFFVVDGALCFDPRINDTVFTSNAALVGAQFARGWEMNGVRVIGLGAHTEDVPDEYIEDAADICDEDVDLAAGGTEKRYSVNGVISSFAGPRQVLADVAMSMGGLHVDMGGAFKFMPGVARTPVHAMGRALIDDDLLADEAIVYTPDRPADELCNTIHSRHVSPAHNWQERALPIRKDAAAITADGGDRFVKNRSYPLVTSGPQCQRLNKMALREARLQGRAEIVCGLWALEYEPGDWEEWTSQRFGGVTKTFWVENVIFEIVNGFDGEPRARVRLVLVETHETVDDWSTEDEASVTTIAVERPVTTLAMSGFACSVADVVAGGVQMPELTFSWDAITDPAVTAIEIEYRIEDDTRIYRTGATPPLTSKPTREGVYPGQKYEARARARAADRLGAWTDWELSDDTGEFSIAPSVISAFWQDSAPDVGTTPAGSYWFDTNDDDAPYKLIDGEWVDASGDALALALLAAADAQDTADGKITTFAQNSAPTAEGVGDLWVDTDDAQRRTYRWSGSAWVHITDQTGYNVAAAIAGQGALATQSLVIFAQTSAPSSPQTGWLWHDTDDAQRRTYRWSGSAWEHVTDQTAVNVASAIAGQGALATQNLVIFAQTSAPSSPQTGWLWLDTDDAQRRTFRWSGSAWDLVSDQTAYNVASAIAGQGALATLSTVGSAQIAAGSVIASKLYTGDSSNVFPDPEMVDTAAYTGDAFTLLAVATDGGPSIQQMRIAADASEKNVRSLAFPVEASRPYYIAAWMEVEGAGSGNAALFIEWFSDNAASTLISTTTVQAGFTSTVPALSAVVAMAPSTAKRAKLLFRKTSGAGRNAVFSAPLVRRATNLGSAGIVTREDGTTLLTDAAAVTALGTAAAIAGQGSGATASSLAGLNATDNANLNAALYTAKRLLVPDFSADGRHWTTSFGGSPDTIADPSAEGYANVANVGRVIRFNAFSRYLTPKGVIKPVPGRRYMFVARLRAETDPSSGAISVALGSSVNGLDSSWAHGTPASVTGASVPGYSYQDTNLQVADGWVTLARVVSPNATPNAYDAYWRPRLDITHSGSGGRVEVAFFDVVDVTDIPVGRSLTDLIRADGVTAVTESALVTSLGTAAGVAGQSPLATLTPPSYAGNAAAVSALGAGALYTDTSDSNKVKTTVSAASGFTLAISAPSAHAYRTGAGDVFSGNFTLTPTGAVGSVRYIVRHLAGADTDWWLTNAENSATNQMGFNVGVGQTKNARVRITAIDEANGREANVTFDFTGQESV